MPNTHSEGVPLNLWLVDAPAGEPSAAPDIAARAVDAYSQPGGRVAVVGGHRRASSIAASANSDAADLVVVLPDLDRRGHQAAQQAVGESACLVRPGGFLVLITPASSAPGVDFVTEAVVAAAAEGLSYFQHVVALVRDDGEPTGHVDVLVFRRGA